MPKYIPGQVWTYHTREGEEASRATVVRVDEDRELGVIVHVYISDVEIRTPEATDGVHRAVTHMPFTEEAMDESVLELEQRDSPLPDYAEGYEIWAEAHAQGEAGMFDCPLAEAIEMMEDSG